MQRMISSCIIAILILGVGISLHAQETIEIGDTINATLNSTGERAEYEFDAEVGDIINISLTSDEFDSFLRLQDPDGLVLVQDDDSGGGRNALISNFTISIAGTYTVIVSSFDDNGEGDFTLSLQATPISELTYGETITGDPAAGTPVNIYTFNGEAGALIVTTLQTTESSGFVELTGPDNSRIGASVYIDPQTSRLGPIELPEDATYTLTVRVVDSYVLRMDVVEPVIIAPGESIVLGQLPAYFQLESDGDTLLDITLDANDTNLRVDLLQPGINVFSQAGTGPLTLSSIGTRNGITYYIVVDTPQMIVQSDEADATESADAQNAAGAILSISETEMLSLDDRPAIISMTPASGQRYLAFSGRAGERVRLVVTSVNGTPMAALTQPLITVTQNNTVLANVTPEGLLRVALDFVLAGNGDVQVLVQTYAAIDYNITLERDPQ